MTDVVKTIRDIKRSLTAPSDVLGPQQKAALVKMGVETPDTLRPPAPAPEPLGYEVTIHKAPRPQMSQDIVERAKAANKAAADAKLQAILKARGADEGATMILDKLNPYTVWIKLAIVAIVLAAVGYTGWTARGWKEDAARKEEAQAALIDYQNRVDEYKKELDNAEARAASYLEKWNKDAKRDAARIAALSEEIRNANVNTVTPRPGEAVRPSEPFNREFVRLYNAPIRVLNGTGGGEANPGAPAGGDTTAARVDRKDLLDVHTYNVDQCRLWKRQVDDILQWDKETFEGKKQ